MNNKHVPSLWLVFAAWAVLAPVVASAGAREERSPEGCTVIGVGRLATVDGSVFTSHTDCCSGCRVHVVPSRTFQKGDLAPVHWGMVYFGKDDDRGCLPLGDYGKVIGHIPQVEKTFTYFHTGYSQMNEHQLAIGESTCSQKPALDVAFVEGVTKQIMAIEQAQVFALERCRTAREALKLHEKNPAEAVIYLTDLTISRMNDVVKMFKSLLDLLLTTYSGDIV